MILKWKSFREATAARRDVKKIGCFVSIRTLLSHNKLSLLNMLNRLLFSSPATRRKVRGCPSGGIAIICKCTATIIKSANCFISIQMSDLVVNNVYLPTNYGDQSSERTFHTAVRLLTKCIKQSTWKKSRCLIIGDFNCNLADEKCSRAQLIKSMLLESFTLVQKDKPYSCISTNNTLTNLDHVLYSGSANYEVKVNSEGSYSNQLPISVAVPIQDPNVQGDHKWQNRKIWEKQIPRCFSELVTRSLIR